MKTTCIMCPLGCDLEIKEENGNISVAGHTCKKGEVYGKEEFTSPKRVVTALIKTNTGKLKSVKTDKPIDKGRIFELLELIKNTTVPDSLKIGDAAVKNALGLCNIVITRA